MNTTNIQVRQWSLYDGENKPYRYGKYISSKWYTRLYSSAKAAEFSQIWKQYTTSTPMNICAGISLSTSTLVCYDIDGHDVASEASLEIRKDAIVELLKDIHINPAIEKSGRGYHVWCVFDRGLTQQERDYIHTLVEMAVPNTEGRQFDTAYIIRLPGLYKDSGTYGIDAETKTVFSSYEAVKAFFSAHMVVANNVDWLKKITVITSGVKPMKRQPKTMPAPKKVVSPEDKAREAFVNGGTSDSTDSEIVTKQIDLEASNFEAFAQKFGFVIDEEGFMPEKVNCVVGDVLGMLRKIKDTNNFGLSVEDFAGKEVNGFLRKSGNQISLFCARSSTRPLAHIVVVGTQKKTRKTRKGADHEKSLSSAYLSIIAEYEPVLDTQTGLIFTNAGQVDDVLRAEMLERCERLTGKMRADIFDAVLQNNAKKVSGRLELIGSLPKWDGVDRIAELASCFQEVASESTKLSLYRKLQIFLSRAILRWSTGLQCPVLTLISARQNIGKSTFAKWLGEVWSSNIYYTPFSDTPIDPTSRDCRMKTTKIMLQELSELGGLSRRDAQDVKNFLTAESIEDRKPYGHFSKSYVPLTVFIATANQDDGLFNDVENRRFLVVNLTAIDRKYSKIDRHQLLAQALELSNTKKVTELSREELDVLKEDNECYNKEDLTTSKMRALFAIDPTSNDFTPVTAIAKAFEEAYGIKLQTVSKAMLQLGAGASVIRKVSVEGTTLRRSVRGYVGLIKLGLDGIDSAATAMTSISDKNISKHSQK